jgi:hypothetical protein
MRLEIPFDHRSMESQLLVELAAERVAPEAVANAVEQLEEGEGHLRRA